MCNLLSFTEALVSLNFACCVALGNLILNHAGNLFLDLFLTVSSNLAKLVDVVWSSYSVDPISGVSKSVCLLYKNWITNLQTCNVLGIYVRGSYANNSKSKKLVLITGSAKRLGAQQR